MIRLGSVKLLILCIVKGLKTIVIDELIKFIVEKFHVNERTVKQYVNDLISKGLLIKEDSKLKISTKGEIILLKNNYKIPSNLKNILQKQNTTNNNVNTVNNDKNKEIPWCSMLSPFTLDNFIQFLRYELSINKLRVRKEISFNGLGRVFKIDCFTQGFVDEVKNLELTQFIQNGLTITYWSTKDKAIIFEYRSLPNLQFEQTLLTINHVSNSIVDLFNFVNYKLIEHVIKVLTLFKLANLINDKFIRNFIKKIFKVRSSIFEISKTYFIHNINKNGRRIEINKGLHELNSKYVEYVELGLKINLNRSKRPRHYRANIVKPFSRIEKFGICLMLNMRNRDVEKCKNNKTHFIKHVASMFRIFIKIFSSFSTNFKIMLKNILYSTSLINNIP